MGQSLFEDDRLWDDTADEVGERLRWPVESSTSNSISCRLYADSSYRFLNARPYSAAFYGSPGEVSRFSLVFANKGGLLRLRRCCRRAFQGRFGDQRSRRVGGNDRAGCGNYRGKTGGHLGYLRRQNYGEGSAKRKVSRWDWNEHSFLLSVVEGEFVSLAIEHSEVADRRGKQDKVADMHIRRIHEANVERRDNGDVVIRAFRWWIRGRRAIAYPRLSSAVRATWKSRRICIFWRCRAAPGWRGNRGLGSREFGAEGGGGRADLQDYASPAQFSRFAETSECGGTGLWGMHSTEWFNDTADRRPPCEGRPMRNHGKKLWRRLLIKWLICPSPTARRTCIFASFTDSIKKPKRLPLPIHGARVLWRGGLEWRRLSIFPTACAG